MNGAVADLEENGKQPFTPPGSSATQFSEDDTPEAAEEGDVDGVADDLAKLATEGGGAAAEAAAPAAKPKPKAAAPPTQQFFAGY